MSAFIPKSASSGIILLVLLFFAAVSSVAQNSSSFQEWELQEIETIGFINSITFSDGNNGWAVGSDGTILHTSDGGTTWNMQTSNSSANLRSVQFIDADTGWIAGSSGTILHTTDGGTTWNTQTTNTSASLHSIHFVNADSGWIAGYSGTILHTSDGGATWNTQSSNTNNYLYGVHFVNADSGWAVGHSGTILHTSNGGATWNTQNSGLSTLLQSVHFVNSNTGWAVGYSGTVLHTSDGGATWSIQSSNTSATLQSVQFIDANNGWAAGTLNGDGVILYTSDGGTSWEVQSSDTSLLQSIYAFDTANAFAAGGISILSTSDSGQSWENSFQGISNILYAVHFANADTGWTVGGYGTILHTIDGGTTWNTQSTNTSVQLYSIQFIDDNTGWASGSSGTILKTTDGGTTWNTHTTNTSASLQSVYFSDANNGWTVGSSGTILRTTDGGATWNTQSGNTSSTLLSVYFADANTGWAVGSSGTIMHTTNGGTTWSVQNSNVSTDVLRSVHFANADTGWVVGSSGTILHTTDGGANWNAQSSNSSAYLYSVHFLNDDTGWAAGSSGTILHTIDGGTTWATQSSNTTADLYSLYFADAGNGWAVGNEGNIIHLNTISSLSSPTIQAPIAQSQVEPPVQLAWQEESYPDNVHFNLHLSTQADFSDTLRYESAFTTNELELTYQEFTEGPGTYYWRVRRQSKSDETFTSDWSSSQFEVAVETPILELPEEGSDVEPPVSLSWSASTNTDYKFQIHLSTQPDFSDTLLYNFGTAASSIELTQSDFDTKGQHYWRVRRKHASDDSLVSEWSSGSFNLILEAPTLIAPLNEERLNMPVTLEWIPPAEGFILKLEVSDDPDFTSLIQLSDSIMGDEPGEIMDRRTLENLPTNETYYWRVQKQGKTNTELKSDWTTREFFVKPDFMRLTLDSTSTSLPNYVNAIFHITDLNGRGVNSLTQEDFQVFNNDNELIPPTGAESSYKVNRADKIPTTTKIVMLLDNSTSLGQNLGQVQEAAVQFIQNKRDNQEIAVYTFSDGNQKIIDFTSDTTSLIQAIKSIELGFNSTDLYGSIIDMYDKWDDSFSLNQIDQGFLVVFSDGDDTAERSSLNEAKAARGSKQVFTVGFGNVDPATLNQLGNAGSFYEQSDISRLTALFQEVQDDLIKLSESFYWFSFASPKRADAEFKVSVGVSGNTNTSSDGTLTLFYNSSNFYSIKSQIYVNSTAQNPAGIDTLTIPGDTTLNIDILSPFSYQTSPYSFNISEPSKLLIEPVASGGNVFTYQLAANGANGDQISIEITDKETTVLDSKKLTVNFTRRNQDPVPPSAAVLASPSDGSVDVSETPKLVWHRADNAVSYHLQVSTTNDFSVLALDTVLTDTVLTTPPLQDGTTHYWRVQSENQDLTADWSTAWSFTTTLAAPPKVVLASPLGPTAESGGTLLFSWKEAGANTDRYRFQLSSTGDFTTPLVDSLTTATKLDLGDLIDGTEYSWRVKAINGAGEGPYSDTATFTYIFVAQKPDIVTLLSPADGATGQAVDPTFVWNKETLATNYQLQVATVSDFSMLFKDSTITDTTLQLTGLDSETTYHWRVRAINGTDQINGEWSLSFSFTTESGFTPPAEVTASVTRTFGSAAGPQDYRLVALPGNINESLAAVLSGKAGVEWQAFWDNGAEENYLLKYDGGDTFSMTPGNGFWVTSTEAFEYSATISAVELNTNNEAVIPLHEGWNIISNPLDVDVAWSDIETANGGSLQPAWGFAGSFADTATFPSAKTGEAFYFLNDRGLTELTIPYKPAAQKAKPKAGQDELRITTVVDGKTTSASGIVFADSENRKTTDIVAPPAGFEGASLRFSGDKTKSSSARTRLFARLYRSFNTGGQHYSMMLSAVPGEEVTIKTGSFKLAGNPDLALIDEETGRRYDLRPGSPVVLIPEKEQTKLTFVVGNASYIDETLKQYLPKQVEVMPNYPNPFNPTTTLKFSLPQQSEVRLQVYDILGRRVATLINGVREAGVHTVRFDASRRASGMYFGVLEIGGQRFVQKMLLIK